MIIAFFINNFLFRGDLLSLLTTFRSKNAKLILEKTNLTNLFDAIADGCDIKNSKPAPDVFLVAAKKLDINPLDCLVIEDAKAGVIAAHKAGMDVLAVGDAQSEKETNYSYNSLKEAIEILAY